MMLTVTTCPGVAMIGASLKSRSRVICAAVVHPPPRCTPSTRTKNSPTYVPHPTIPVRSSVLVNGTVYETIVVSVAKGASTSPNTLTGLVYSDTTVTGTGVGSVTGTGSGDVSST